MGDKQKPNKKGKSQGKNTNEIQQIKTTTENC